jgi:hypothetical protein
LFETCGACRPIKSKLRRDNPRVEDALSPCTPFADPEIRNFIESPKNTDSARLLGDGPCLRMKNHEHRYFRKSIKAHAGGE